MDLGHENMLYFGTLWPWLGGLFKKNQSDHTCSVLRNRKWADYSGACYFYIVKCQVFFLFFGFFIISVFYFDILFWIRFSYWDHPRPKAVVETRPWPLLARRTAFGMIKMGSVTFFINIFISVEPISLFIGILIGQRINKHTNFK